MRPPDPNAFPAGTGWLGLASWNWLGPARTGRLESAGWNWRTRHDSNVRPLPSEGKGSRVSLTCCGALVPDDLY